MKDLCNSNELLLISYNELFLIHIFMPNLLQKENVNDKSKNCINPYIVYNNKWLKCSRIFILYENVFNLMTALWLEQFLTLSQMVK